MKKVWIQVGAFLKGSLMLTSQFANPCLHDLFDIDIYIFVILLINNN